jgi:Zn-dependent peptidase ImmA (M78 family)
LKKIKLDEFSVADIDAQVLKILRDLGNPEPPLHLEHVRELLKLDRDYYSVTDDGLLNRWVHSLKLAGKQIAKRPGFLKDFIKNFRLDALVLFDEKRILISNELPEPKRRWAEAHEIGHLITPWHDSISLGDDKYTLHANCREIMEAEANYGASRLLFLRDKFKSHALSSEPTLSFVKNLKKLYGNTITTTLYSFIETLDVPAFGLITGHPKKQDTDFDPMNPCRHFITSSAFEAQFGHITDVHLYAILQGYCTYGKYDLGRTETILSNTRKEPHVFSMETIFNKYDALTLGVLIGRHDVSVSV